MHANVDNYLYNYPIAAIPHAFVISLTCKSMCGYVKNISTDNTWKHPNVFQSRDWRLGLVRLFLSQEGRNRIGGRSMKKPDLPLYLFSPE